jgi:SAM-dependent methyltransferase
MLFEYEGYRIPVDLINLTGAGPESFDAISKAHIVYLQKNVGLRPDATVLEIGSGIGRDAIPMTQILSPELGGRYIGVDIIGRSVEWCSDNISRRHNNFQFIHYDVKDQLHNPNGTTTTNQIHLPLENKSVDLVILWSVFTHMFESDILHYLNEFRRVIKDKGSIFFTCFIVDERILAAIRQSAPTPYALRFDTRYGEGCWINDRQHPAGAVAYDEATLRRLVTSAGLRMLKDIPGNWSGVREGTAGQDGMVLALPAEVGFGGRVINVMRRLRERTHKS